MRLTGKNKRILVILAVLVLVFSVGCGKKKKKVDSVDEPEIASKDYLSGVDEDTLIMNSDGGIIEIACDDYSGESFDYSTLSDDIQKEIDAFNESKGKDKVSLLQYSESAGKVKAAIRYLNIEAYNEFNGTDYKLQMYEPSECNIIVLEEEKKKAESMASSEELAEVARKGNGIDVIVEDMASWITDEPYDGIWSCASLLHLDNKELISFFQNLNRNLKVEGAIYISVKTAIETGVDNKGRFMKNFTEEELRGYLDLAGIEIVETWDTGDQLNREGFSWINVIGIKR